MKFEACNEFWLTVAGEDFPERSGRVAGRAQTTPACLRSRDTKCLMQHIHTFLNPVMIQERLLHSQTLLAYLNLPEITFYIRVLNLLTAKK
ncbi:hypothetical protein PR048_025040 [Dryococelus australis]|uniref:Uncharacterized protein n=1 Tax=Dryococelus australis TaxID=614101 RepID=A0ABQ9GQB1_9NEOP|nr:hypothetical protein PR048_025040 [Dryococelus australis]